MKTIIQHQKRLKTQTFLTKYQLEQNIQKFLENYPRHAKKVSQVGGADKSSTSPVYTEATKN